LEANPGPRSKLAVHSRPDGGKTEKDGYTWLSSRFQDNTTEGVMRSKEVAVKTEDSWKTAEEATGDGGNGFNPGTS